MVLQNAWLLLSSDMKLACLHIKAGLTQLVTEQDVHNLLLASHCCRYQPLDEGIKKATLWLNILQSDPDAPIPQRPIPIAKRHDAKVIIAIEKNQMSASAHITADWGGKPLTPERLHKAIAMSKIKRGISEAQLSTALQWAKEAAPGSQMTLAIAFGQPAVDGLDTDYERLVETPAERMFKAKSQDHNQAELSDLDSIVTVKAGTPLMRRHPATLGVPGFTVTGQKLPARNGKDSPMCAGEGTCFSPDDPDLLIASRAGLPCKERSGMKVDEVLSLTRADALQGNITFDGGLIVSGDVDPGIKISVSGDIIVGGFIEGGQIEAGGSITVRHGIIGRRNEQGEYLCQLNARGEIHANNAQYAQLEAGGDIQIQSQLSHCYSRSGRDIKVGDSHMRKGHLLGGVSIAHRLIISPVLGASAGNPTRLQLLGGYFAHKEQEQRLKESQKASKEQLDKLKALVMSLLRLPRDKRNPETLYKLKPIKERHQLELQRIEGQLAANRQKMQKIKAEMEVVATKRLFAGIEVEIADLKRQITITRGPTHLTSQNETLAATPYERHH